MRSDNFVELTTQKWWLKKYYTCVCYEKGGIKNNAATTKTG